MNSLRKILRGKEGGQFYLVAITSINPIDGLVNIGNCFLHMVKEKKEKSNWYTDTTYYTRALYHDGAS